MITHLFESSISLFDSILCIYFMMKFNNSSWKKSRFAIPAIVLYFVVTLIGDYVMPNFNMVTTIALLLISIAYAFTVCERHYVRAIIAACIYKMVFILLSSLIITVLSLLFTDFQLLLYGGNSIGRYVYVVIHKVALFAILTFLIHIFNKDDYMEIKNGVYTLIISITTIIGLAATFAIIMLSDFDKYGNQILVITSSFVLVNIIVYFMTAQIQKLQKNKYELQLLQEKEKFEQERHNDISVMWENIRKVQHDMKQHLTVILCHLENGEVDKCRQYVDEFLPTINYTNRLVSTENTVLDYLINTKLGSLKDTEIYVSEKIVDLSDIREADLACIMGNVFDNAIEAIKNLEDKRIELIFDFINANRVIICRNTIEKSVLEHNKTLKSTKPGREGNGLGHKIIEKVVKDYGGMVGYFEENGMFGVEIILPIPDYMLNRSEEWDI